MSWLLPPTTFAEGQRGLMVWMLFGAGVVCTVLAIGALLIIWLDPAWPAALAQRRLDLIGLALLGALLGMAAVIVSLAIGGPVGRFRGRVGEVEVEAEAKPQPQERRDGAA